MEAINADPLAFFKGWPSSRIEDATPPKYMEPRRLPCTAPLPALAGGHGELAGRPRGERFLVAECGIESWSLDSGGLGQGTSSWRPPPL